MFKHVVIATLTSLVGQEDYSHIRPLSYQDAHVFLICFAVDNRDSFDNVENKVGTLQACVTARSHPSVRSGSQK
jgi:GTPase SAR1 family protein